MDANDDTVASSDHSLSEDLNPLTGSTAYGDVAVHRSTLSPLEGERAVDI
jgi:hypothetical protein